MVFPYILGVEFLNKKIPRGKGVETSRGYDQTLTGIAIQGIVKTRMVMSKTTLFSHDACPPFDWQEERIWGYE